MVSKAFKKQSSPTRTRREIEEGSPLALRIREHKSRRGRVVTIRCGCCKQSIDIMQDAGPLDRHFSPVEINGIYA